MAPSRLSPPFGAERAQTKLTADQLNRWQEDGFLVIQDALSPTTVNSMLDESRHLLSSFPLDGHPMTKFCTGESLSHVGDDYFLTSGDKIRFFFETEAFSSTGELVKPKEYAINKIGHYLHELSPPFREATFSELHRAIARLFGFQDPRVLQSMVICKQPEIGGAVPPHQDSTFLYTDPPSAVGFWIPLEDATAENGTLSFAKGSHRRAPVKTRFVRKQTGGTGFEEVKGRYWSASLDSDEEDREEDREEIYDLHEIKAGSLVLIHGNLLHKSEKNSSGKSRFIYTFHMIEGDSEHEYDEKNWLQPPKNGFSKLYNE